MSFGVTRPLASMVMVVVCVLPPPPPPPPPVPPPGGGVGLVGVSLPLLHPAANAATTIITPTARTIMLVPRSQVRLIDCARGYFSRISARY